MAEIKAFKGLRYTEKAGKIDDLVCPPYDIISENERKAFLENNSCNVIRLELPRGEDPYAEAGATLTKWLQDSILSCDMDEGLYIYELKFKSAVESGKEMSLKGLVCRVRIEDFETGVVLPHEETLSKAKTDRFNLFKATNCNFSPIYSLFPDEKHVTRERMDRICAATAPRYDFDDALVTHRLWVVNDPVTISAFCEDFTDRKLYIADGHHRYETSINYRNYCRDNDIYNPGSNYVMMFLTDMADEGLVVFPTHRLIRGLEVFDEKALLESSKVYFDIERIALDDVEGKMEELSKENKKAFTFYTQENCYLLVLKDKNAMREIIPKQSDAYRFLDVSILHGLILERLLGIDKENMANQKNLTYTRSFAEAVQSVNCGESQCAFFLNPTAVSEIGEVAAAGEKMPQKSTYFYPKLTTGLVMNKMDEV